MTIHTPTRWLVAAAASAVSMIARADCATELQALQEELNVIGQQQQLHDTDATADLRRLRALRETAEVLQRYESEEACKETVAEARQVMSSLTNLVALTSKDIIGHEIRNAHGEELGEIKEIIFDLKRGAAAYVLVGFGGFLGFGEELVPVPFSALSMDSDSFLLHMSHERLRDAPRYNAKNAHGMVNRRWHESVYNYFGEQPYWNTEQQARLQSRIDQLNQEIENIGRRQKELATRYRKRKMATGSVEDTDWRTGIEQQINELRTAFTEVETLRAQVARLRDEQRRAATGTGAMASTRSATRSVSGEASSPEQHARSNSSQGRSDESQRALPLQKEATPGADTRAAAPLRGYSAQIDRPNRVSTREHDNAREQDNASSKPAQTTTTSNASSSNAADTSNPQGRASTRTKPGRPAEASDTTVARDASTDESSSDQFAQRTSERAMGHETGDQQLQPSKDERSNATPASSGKTASTAGPPTQQRASEASVNDHAPDPQARAESAAENILAAARGRPTSSNVPAESRSDAARRGESATNDGASAGDPVLGRLLARLDRDEDGKISENEATRDFVVYKHFADLDQNQDGVLDLAEFDRLGNMPVTIDKTGELIPRPVDAKPNENWSGPKRMTPAADSPGQSESRQSAAK